MKLITIVRRPVLVFFFFITGIASHAQSWQDTVALIEKQFEKYKPGNPGCQFAISRHGQVIFSRAWGIADLEHGVPLSNESVIEAGSVSKQFTAAAILLLEQQGKLSLGDDLRKYVPEIPDYGSTITLRHMMQHTSGLKDWGAIAGIAGWPRSTKTYNNNDALYIISRQQTLNHAPGEEYVYSNSNYNLFAVIVERVSGQSLAEFTRIHIFEPAGMTHTEWRNDYKKVVPNRSIAYSKTGSRYATEMPNEYVYGNGGLLTTAEDLLKWNDFYLSGKLGNPSLLNRQLALTPFNNGKTNYYGAGLIVDSLGGWKMISHNGATAAYRANLEHFPELGLSFAWLSNTSEFDTGSNASEDVRDIFVKSKTTKPKPDYPVVDIPADRLGAYEGWYRDPRSAAGVRVFVKDGKLTTTRGGTTIPVSENEFLLGSNRIIISTVKQGLYFVNSDMDSTFYPKMPLADTSSSSIANYTGEYYSEETESKFTILIKNGRLVAHRAPKTDYVLTPTYKDAFNFGGAVMQFDRNKKNKVTAMKIYAGRARNVRFNRVK